MSQTASFIIARLKHASPAELAYRMKQGLFRYCVDRLARRNVDFAGKTPSLAPGGIAGLDLPEFCGEIEQSVVFRIVEGGLFCHGASREYIHSCEIRLGSSYRRANPESTCPMDIRTIWEPARLQHLTYLLATLGRAGNMADIPRCKPFVQREILTWLRRNPFPCGPHYLSAMECALRIPVFVYSLKLLDSLTASESAEIATAIYKHAWWIENNLSLYSSLGNHTVSEAVGLVFGGALFRHVPRGASWLERGIALLLQELDHQILPDGGPAEQAFAYHRFVLDLYWLAVDFLERNQLRSCGDITGVLRSGEDFLAAMSHRPGALPSIGDSDDGHAVAPGLAPKRESGSVGEPGVRGFKKSGYSVFRGANGVALTFDHGPLGMSPLHNHGHADALSITLSQDGEPLLVDPGTYRYNGEPEFRAYFRGTRAHNTVTIDDQDQAFQKTGFIWQQPYRTGIVRNTQCNGLPLIEALHDGYARLTDQVRHKRLIMQVDNCHFVVRDSFWGEGEHRFELNFHLHPEAAVERDGPWWRIHMNGRELFLKLPDGGGTAVFGQTNPPLGWFSESYGSRRECVVLQSSRNGQPDQVNFVSLLCIATPMTPSREESVLCTIESLV